MTQLTPTASYALRIYHEDVDIFGIVYHANYLKYMERARTEWLMGAGFDQRDLLKQQIGFLIYSVELSFLKPAKFFDALQIVTKIIEQGKASITVEQTVHLQSDPHCIFCVGKIKIACVNTQTQKPCALPW